MHVPFVIALVAAQTQKISPSTALAIVGGVAIVIVAILLILRKIERDRTEALRQASVTIGFAFEETGDIEQVRALGDLPLFTHGRGKRVKNVMSGRDAVGEVRIFDYQYTTGGGKSAHTWSQTVALYTGRGRRLPDFVLSPENPIFRALGHLLRWQDINFDSNPAFSSAFMLRGPDETAIRAVFTAEILAFLEQHTGWTIEVQGGNVGIYRAERRVKPAELGMFREETAAVLRGVTGPGAASAR